MAGKTSTLELPYPVEGESADVPRDIKALAEKLEGNLKAIPLSQLAHGTSGQLIVVQGTGAAAYKALSGDATINAAGELQLGANSVGAAEIASGAVGESEVADAAVTSRKLKPTTGVVYGTEGSDLTCGSSYADVPGASLSITPLVASILRVTLVVRRKTGSGPVNASLKVDSASELSATAQIDEATGVWKEGSAVQVYSIALTAAAHTIKLRAQLATAAAASVWSGQSGFSYELIAS